MSGARAESSVAGGASKEGGGSEVRGGKSEVPVPTGVNWREIPGTLGFAAVWTAVFGSLLYAQGGFGSWFQLFFGEGLSRGLLVGYGAITPDAVAKGEVWRCLTANMLHLNVLHLALNAWGLYSIGSLVEEWYGVGQYVMVTVLIGGLGNLLAALARLAMGDGQIASLGGSTIVFGMIGLCAVVGWRTKRSHGHALWVLMLGLLLANGAIGLMIEGVDNVSHACGALVGALTGLADGALFRNAGRRWTLAAGVAAVLLLFGAMWHQERLFRRALTESAVEYAIGNARRGASLAAQELEGIRLLAQVAAIPDARLDAMDSIRFERAWRESGFGARVRIGALTPSHRSRLREAIVGGLRSDRTRFGMGFGTEEQVSAARGVLARALFKTLSAGDLRELDEATRGIAERAGERLAEFEREMRRSAADGRLRVRWNRLWSEMPKAVNPTPPPPGPERSGKAGEGGADGDGRVVEALERASREAFSEKMEISR